LHEKEKYALMRQSAAPIESTVHVQNNSKQSSQQPNSPLNFIQSKLKSLEATGDSMKSGIEHFLSSMDHLEDSEEITEHEIDHRDHPQAQPPQDLPPVIKQETELHEKLPPVVKLATPDLLTVEIFSDALPSAQRDEVENSDMRMPGPPMARFNPFLKEDLETDSVTVPFDANCDNSGNQYSVESEDTLIPRGPSGVQHQVTKDSSANHDSSLPSSTITEERLLSVVGDDDIVFNSKPKKHKKKKKGTCHSDIQNFGRR
jgi:hypothetical protein